MVRTLDQLRQEQLETAKAYRIPALDEVRRERAQVERVSTPKVDIRPSVNDASPDIRPSVNDASPDITLSEADVATARKAGYKEGLAAARSAAKRTRPRAKHALRRYTVSLHKGQWEALRGLAHRWGCNCAEAARRSIIEAYARSQRDL